MAKVEGLVDIKDEQIKDILVLRLSGRLDALSSPVVEKKIFDFINNGQHNLLLDFSNVEYLSSAGMRMLLSTTKKLKNLEGKLVVFGVISNVMDVLKMSGFDHVLDLAKTEQEGMSHF